MGDRLKDKVAVVTGAGRGIGRGEALALAAEGARVVVNDPGVERDGTGTATGVADGVVEEIKKMGGIAVPSYDSVASMQGGENIIKTAIDSFGRLDILVNNAGILRDRMVFNMSEEEWDSVLSVHLKGHFACTKYACIWFRQQKQGGRIINTSSTSGLGNMGQANYSAAKEGIAGLTRTVARDMGKYGVTCNAIRPTAGTRMTVTPEMKAAWERQGKMDRLREIEELNPELVAPFVVYLATDEAANINGRIFQVYAGTVALYPEPEPIKAIYKEGKWTLDELSALMPKTLSANLVNEWAAPPEG